MERTSRACAAAGTGRSPMAEAAADSMAATDSTRPLISPSAPAVRIAATSLRMYLTALLHVLHASFHSAAPCA